MSFDFEMSIEEKRERGYLRARDEAYDAIYTLWLRRAAQDNVSQKDLAAYLGRDTGWVSRALAGPANWTMKTFGELAEALDGVISIKVEPVEDVESGNFDIYNAMSDETQNLLTLPTTVVQSSSSTYVSTISSAAKLNSGKLLVSSASVQ